jgi:hypothetical protein
MQERPAESALLARWTLQKSAVSDTIKFMCFAVGQAYESTTDGRKAVVTQIRSDGREGLLRIDGDASREQWFLSTDLNQNGGEWCLIGLICPICGEKAKPLDKVGDADGFECANHDRFRVVGSVFAIPALRDATRQKWEDALKRAKARQLGAWAPTITTDDFESPAPAA